MPDVLRIELRRSLVVPALVTLVVLAGWVPGGAQTCPDVVVGHAANGGTRMAAIAGHIAVVDAGFSSGGHGLKLIDLSDLAAPRTLGSIHLDEVRFSSLAIDDLLVVAGVYGGGIVVFDVANPARPRLVGSLELPDTVEGITLHDGLAFLAVGEAGLWILDLSDPTAPAVVGSVDTPGTALRVAVDGDLAVELPRND